MHDGAVRTPLHSTIVAVETYRDSAGRTRNVALVRRCDGALVLVDDAGRTRTARPQRALPSRMLTAASA